MFQSWIFGLVIFTNDILGRPHHEQNVGAVIIYVGWFNVEKQWLYECCIQHSNYMWEALLLSVLWTLQLFVMVCTIQWCIIFCCFVTCINGGDTFCIFCPVFCILSFGSVCLIITACCQNVCLVYGLAWLTHLIL